MSLRLLNVVPLGIAPVAVHDEGDMAGHVASLQHVHAQTLVPGEFLVADPGHGDSLREEKWVRVE